MRFILQSKIKTLGSMHCAAVALWISMTAFSSHASVLNPVVQRNKNGNQ